MHTLTINLLTKLHIHCKYGVLAEFQISYFVVVVWFKTKGALFSEILDIRSSQHDDTSQKKRQIFVTKL
jgi:hypothetical protein